MGIVKSVFPSTYYAIYCRIPEYIAFALFGKGLVIVQLLNNCVSIILVDVCIATDYPSYGHLENC